MMGYGWNMVGGTGFFGSLFGLIVLTDLVLLGIWLWKQINKK